MCTFLGEESGRHQEAPESRHVRALWGRRGAGRCEIFPQCPVLFSAVWNTSGPPWATCSINFTQWFSLSAVKIPSLAGSTLLLTHLPWVPSGFCTFIIRPFIFSPGGSSLSQRPWAPLMGMLPLWGSSHSRPGRTLRRGPCYLFLISSCLDTREPSTSLF